MFSLAVLFFCQSLIQFLKDVVPLSTGNMHHIVGINQPPVQWRLQCLHKEAVHLLPGRVWVCVCSVLQGLVWRAWNGSLAAQYADCRIYMLGSWG